jgi:hypothetical protein
VVENLLQDHRVHVDRNDLFRAMGYPDASRVSRPVRDICLEQLDRLAQLAEPWGNCRELPIDGIERERVCLRSGAILHGRRIAGLLRHATAVQLCLVTVGDAITAAIHRLLAADHTIQALALDAAASAATHALITQLRERICAQAARHGCGTTIPYGPGYTGWDIHDLPPLLSCFTGSDDAPPVRLNAQCMMIPEKSLFCAVGIVPGMKESHHDVTPCRLCDLTTCSLRQVS